MDDATPEGSKPKGIKPANLTAIIIAAVVVALAGIGGGYAYWTHQESTGYHAAVEQAGKADAEAAAQAQAQAAAAAAQPQSSYSQSYNRYGGSGRGYSSNRGYSAPRQSYTPSNNGGGSSDPAPAPIQRPNGGVLGGGTGPLVDCSKVACSILGN